MRFIDSDTRLFILALVVVIGGGYALVWAPNVAGDVKIFIGGAIGTVLTFFFGRSVATQAVSETNGRLERAVTRAVANIPAPPPPPGT